MIERRPIQLDNRIYLIDGFDMGIPSRTGTYVILEDDLTLIETGPSPSVKHIKKGLEFLGFSLQDVKNIIVTHVHLDHSGGAGYLLQQCPNAKVYVHPRGARHLADPKRLAAAARGIYGESFAEFFDPIIPVPEHSIIIAEEGGELQIGTNCTLKFYETPGHAKHHISIYDPVSNGMFTGDTAGVRYEQLLMEGVPLYLPSTSPNHFDPNAMKQSIERIQTMKLNRIYFGHFGMTEEPLAALKEVSAWLDIFMELAEKVYYVEDKGYDVLADRMFMEVQKYLRTQGIDDDHEAYIIINLDMQICALGIIDYFQKLSH